MTAIQPTNAMKVLQPSKMRSNQDAISLKRSQATFKIQIPKSNSKKHHQTIQTSKHNIERTNKQHKEDDKETVRGWEPAVREKIKRKSIGIDGVDKIDGNIAILNDMHSGNGAVSTENIKRTVSRINGRIDGIHQENGPSEDTQHRMNMETESMGKEKKLIDVDVNRMNKPFGLLLEKSIMIENERQCSMATSVEIIIPNSISSTPHSMRMDIERMATEIGFIGNGQETASGFEQTGFEAIAEIPKTLKVYVLSIVLRKYTLNTLKCRDLLSRDHGADMQRTV